MRPQLCSQHFMGNYYICATNLISNFFSIYFMHLIHYTCYKETKIALLTIIYRRVQNLPEWQNENALTN